MEGKNIEIISSEATKICSITLDGTLELDVLENVDLIAIVFDLIYLTDTKQRIIPHQNISELIIDTFRFSVLPTRITFVKINKTSLSNVPGVIELYLPYPSLMLNNAGSLTEKDKITLIEFGSDFPSSNLKCKWTSFDSDKKVHGFNDIASIFDLKVYGNETYVKLKERSNKLLPMKICLANITDANKCAENSYIVEDLNEFIPDGIMDLKIDVVSSISIDCIVIRVGNKGRLGLNDLEKDDGNYSINPTIVAESGYCDITSNINEIIKMVVQNADIVISNDHGARSNYYLKDSNITYTYKKEFYNKQRDSIIGESGFIAMKSLLDNDPIDYYLNDFVGKGESKIKVAGSFYNTIKLEESAELNTSSHLSAYSIDSSISL